MTNEAYANLPDVLNANMLAETLGISRAGAYQLLNSEDFPTLHIGKRKHRCTRGTNKIKKKC